MLEGLAVAIANVDEMIELIKGSPTPPVAKERLLARTWKPGRRARDGRARGGRRGRLQALRPRAGVGLSPDGYRLSEIQAQEILQMRLQRLTGLEQDKIVQEYREVMETIADLLDILAKPERINTIIGDELKAIKASTATRPGIRGARRSSSTRPSSTPRT